MRLGATSFVIPDDIIPNAHFLRDRFDDIELLVFEYNETHSPLPSVDTVDELSSLAKDHDLTYTVHLPLDLNLLDVNYATGSQRALEVIERFRPLSPVGYILHLDGPSSGLSIQREINTGIESVQTLCNTMPEPELLCLENLENQPMKFISSILSETPCSMCLDIGHLWKTGADPIIWIDHFCDRIRVIHLHGIYKRDHKDLTHVEPDSLRNLLKKLGDSFRGVLTIEVFNQWDLNKSLLALSNALASITPNEIDHLEPLTLKRKIEKARP